MLVAAMVAAAGLAARCCGDERRVVRLGTFRFSPRNEKRENGVVLRPALLRGAIRRHKKGNLLRQYRQDATRKKSQATCKNAIKQAPLNLSKNLCDPTCCESGFVVVYYWLLLAFSLLSEMRPPLKGGAAHTGHGTWGMCMGKL